MKIPYNPIQHYKARRARTRQKQVAIRMMALSGVIRPSHIELRYGTPMTQARAVRADPSLVQATPVTDIPREPHSRCVKIDLEQRWNRVCAFTSALIQLGKKPIGLQWNTD